jgi:membrane protein involved in colicin uptake
MFRNPAIRLATVATATVAVLAAGPVMGQALGLGGSAPEPMPAAWEASKQVDADNAAASHEAVLEAEKERKRAEREKREAEEAKKAQQAAERRAAEERAARARASQGGTPAQNRALGMQMCADRGWSTSQCNDLDKLWQKESGWNHNAHNGSSGAHGIPQALPGSKMGSHGSDWATNPATQIAWGLDYIAGRYGNPSNAWAHSVKHGWY